MTNPLQAIPAKVRLWLYLVYATLGPVLLYTKAQGWTGTAEIDLWVGLGVALGITAASNITPASGVEPYVPERMEVVADGDLNPAMAPDADQV
ncbi:MAG: hypothetical protein IPM11_01365 [Micropruina sp.]|nr:hypothetical protein [Micropruina sp.]MBK9156775.1 hypothetical protein [Micropruina sp.]